MKAVLVLLLLGLSGLLYVQWEIAPEQVPVASPQRGSLADEGKPAPAAKDGVELSDLADPGAFDVISQRPLFSAERRPPEDTAAEVAAPPQAVGLEGLDFSAVAITPNKSIAWVKDAQSGELVRLESGGEIRGWTVKAVQPERLLLTAGEQTAELELREFPAAAAPPPSVRPPQRPVRRRAGVPANRARPQQRARPTNRTPRR